MTTFLSQDVQNDLSQALMARRKTKTRLRIIVGSEVYPLLDMTRSSFSLDAQDAPKLRGLVDVFDGGRHLCQALIIASHRDGDEMVFDFKRNTMTSNGPALDFERDQLAPAGLITHK